MADVNYFRVSNGKDLSVADAEARIDIDELRDTKQDTLVEGDNISIVSNKISSSHPPTPLSSDTTSEVTLPLSGGSFYTVDDVVRDDFGHVRSINIKTVNIPGGGGSGSGIDDVSYNADILTINLSDGNVINVSLGNPVANLSLDGSTIMITYEDGSSGLLSLSGDSEVDPYSDNFVTSKAVYNAISSTFSSVSSQIDSKQNLLIEGDNIEIFDDRISSVNTTYSAGENITIDDDNMISASNTTYSAGENIAINNNVISALNTTYSFDTFPVESSNNGITSGGVYSAIQSAASSVYEYKGACNREDLPVSSSHVGDVWNLTDASEFGPSGTNVAWNGTEWQVLGGSYSAGLNITISNSGVISAKNTTYSAGNNITIDNDVISANPYVPGDNISIEENVISANNTTYSAGQNITIEEDNSINSNHPFIEIQGDSTSDIYPEFGSNFTAIDRIIKDSNGHILSLNTKTISLPQELMQPGDNIYISDGVISAVNTTYSAGTNVDITDDNVINANHIYVPIYGDTTSYNQPSPGSTVSMIDSVERDELGHVTTVNLKTIKLPDASVPTPIEIDSILDENSYNPVTNSAITLGIYDRVLEPSSEGRPGQVLTTDGHGGRYWSNSGGGGGTDTTYHLTNESGIITLTDSNGNSDTISMDTTPILDSIEPITSGGVYSAIQSIPTYSPGTNIHISDSGMISAVNTTYSAGENITIIDNVISAQGTTYTFDDHPQQGSTNPVTSEGIYLAIQQSPGTTYSQGDNIVISDNNEISSYHPPVNIQSDTTNSITPSPGESFDVVDIITRDDKGHIEKVNTTTVRLPSSQGKTYVLTNEDGVITLTDSDSGKSEIPMDSEPSSGSYAPVTSDGIFNWVSSKLNILDTFERFILIEGDSQGFLRLKDTRPSDQFPTRLDLRLMKVPSEVSNMTEFLFYNSTIDPQDNMEYYSYITELNASIDTSFIRRMDGCFREMYSLKSIDLTGWDTSNVIGMDHMFYKCTNLISLDISSFDMTNVMNIDYFISFCISLITLDISGCDMSNARYSNSILKGLNKIVNVITDSNTKLPPAYLIDMMSSSDLTLQSCINILDALPDVTHDIGHTHELMFYGPLWMIIDDDDEGTRASEEASARGWTLVK